MFCAASNDAYLTASLGKRVSKGYLEVYSYPTARTLSFGFAIINICDLRY